MSEANRVPWVVGISGASGTPYAAAVIRGLLDGGEDVDLIVSRAARLTLFDETGIRFHQGSWRQEMERWIDRDLSGVVSWRIDDFAAGPSSGSYRSKGTIIVPASTASVAGIYLGISKDLLQRAGEVALKERRPLVLVVRETPLRQNTLNQLAMLAGEGAVIFPASPGFYAGSESVAQLVDFLAGKVLDVLHVEHDLYRRWTGKLSQGNVSIEDPEDSFEDD